MGLRRSLSDPVLDRSFHKTKSLQPGAAAGQAVWLVGEIHISGEEADLAVRRSADRLRLPAVVASLRTPR